MDPNFPPQPTNNPNPAPDPAPTPQPAIPTQTTPSVMEEGGKISGPSGKLEIAIFVSLGIACAAWLSQIWYYRQQLKGPTTVTIKNQIEDMDRKLVSVLGDKYERA